MGDVRRGRDQGGAAVLILRGVACLALAWGIVALLLQIEGLPPEEADALWREAMDSAVRTVQGPGG